MKFGIVSVVDYIKQADSGCHVVQQIHERRTRKFNVHMHRCFSITPSSTQEISGQRSLVPPYNLMSLPRQICTHNP